MHACTALTGWSSSCPTVCTLVRMPHTCLTHASHMLARGSLSQACSHVCCCCCACVHIQWLEYFLAYCGALAFEGDPIEWSKNHRWHHQNSDSPADRHSPRDGLWHAHMGWLFDESLTNTRWAACSELLTTRHRGILCSITHMFLFVHKGSQLNVRHSLRSNPSMPNYLPPWYSFCSCGGVYTALSGCPWPHEVLASPHLL
jgi:hypothetical protein